MGIQTDSTPLEDPKDPNTCNVFALYKLLASQEQAKQIAEQIPRRKLWIRARKDGAS